MPPKLKAHGIGDGMIDWSMGTALKEKDLGDKVSADMKVSEQSGIAASKGNQMYGLIRRNITFKDKANYTYV